MRTILVTVFISLMNITMITAQNKGDISLDVAGLNPYKNTSDREIRQALGEPFKYSRRVSELGETREYRYGPQENYDLFRYSEFSQTLEFTLENSTYSLFKGRIKIGKNISAFLTLEGGLLEKKSSKLYYFYPLGKITEDYLEIETDSTGTIKLIMFTSPV